METRTNREFMKIKLIGVALNSMSLVLLARDIDCVLTTGITG